MESEHSPKRLLFIWIGFQESQCKRVYHEYFPYGSYLYVVYLVQSFWQVPVLVGGQLLPHQ